MQYHTKSINEILIEFNTNREKGLSTKQVLEQQKLHGLNTLPKKERDSVLQKVLNQFKDILILILIIAAIVSAIVGEHLDAIVILVIVVINATMGFIQEQKAEKAIEALKKLSTDYAKVIREGEIEQIETTQLVPGDIILLESGDKIPADARIIETVNLEVSEAVLTGESKPVRKSNLSLSNENLALADRKNMLYRNTSINYGRAKAVVVTTGINTEIGKISALLQEDIKNETPLSKELDHVGKSLSYVAITIIGIVFFIGVFVDGMEIKDTFLTSISLAVASIPEGLPAVITLSLAIGVSKLAKQNAIIRKLQAVETLGSVNYILTDKTGTLTQNKMTVTHIATLEQEVLEQDFSDSQNLNWLIETSVLCNDANYSHDKFIGDSTETALLEFAKHKGFDISKLRKRYTRVYEIPFSSETKKMLVVVRDIDNPENMFVLAKGAPDVIKQIAKEDSLLISELNETYTKQGLRSLAFSYKKITQKTLEKALSLDNPEDELSVYHNFLGIISQSDPLRVEVKDAMLLAKKAGIKTIMITGDHKLTATSIAYELELIHSDNEVIDGTELGDTTGDLLKEILKHKKVFARVSPQQKLNIVNTVKDMGYVVAVTGDGVNDAPAIKSADIGISMGITGTDVAKEVSDMVLQDDNYATIVSAIKEGRTIYDNLVKFITYLISCNISEILVVAGAIIARLPLPLLPIQILWVNLITDGFPALALGMEPAEKDIMQRLPRNMQGNDQKLLSKNRWKQMVFHAGLITIATFGIFYLGYHLHNVENKLRIIQTLTLTTLTFSQLFHAFNKRSDKHSILSKNLTKNNALIYTFFLSVIIQIAVVYLPIANTVLKTVPLKPELFMYGILFSLIPVIGSEIHKAYLNHVHNNTA